LTYLEREGVLCWDVVAVEDVDSKKGNGFTVVARKRAQPRDLPPTSAGPVGFHFLTLDLPFQVACRNLEHVIPGAELPAELDLPRGVYRVDPVHVGFPPKLGARRRVTVGRPLPPPVIESVSVEVGFLRIHGEHLCETTYIESRLPHGRILQLLPQHDRGTLLIELVGPDVPEVSVPIWAVNLPPMGGRSVAFQCPPLRAQSVLV
jgi:hypothetical protein